MFFKRNEGFRYEFPEPLEANFKLLVNGRADALDQVVFEGKIHDISPKGMKMFSDADFGEHTNKVVQLEVHFILDEAIIIAIGNIVWKKPYAKGFMYGLTFDNQPKLEEVILFDLKARRRKEMTAKRNF